MVQQQRYGVWAEESESVKRFPFAFREGVSQGRTNKLEDQLWMFCKHSRHNCCVEIVDVAPTKNFVIAKKVQHSQTQINVGEVWANASKEGSKWIFQWQFFPFEMCRGLESPGPTTGYKYIFSGTGSWVVLFIFYRSSLFIFRYWLQWCKMFCIIYCICRALKALYIWQTMEHASWRQTNQQMAG